MVEALIQIQFEDWVSPLLKSLDGTTMPSGMSLPALPENMARFETVIRGGRAVVTIFPSFDLIAWFAHVSQAIEACASERLMPNHIE